MSPRRAQPSSIALPLLAVLVGCPQGKVTERSPKRPAPSPTALPHPWPPVGGQPFPDLKLRDPRGETVDLATLRGKVLLIETAGMSCPGTQALSGGNLRGGFQGGTPQGGLAGIDVLLQLAGVDPLDPDLVLVQLLLFDMKLGSPSLEDAQAWVKHFGLDESPNTLVLLGDERTTQHPASYGLVPGFYVVGRDGTVVVDASNGCPPEAQSTFLPTLKRLLAERPADVAALTSAAGAGASSFPDPASLPEAAERARGEERHALLANGRWDELEALFAAERRSGRLDGRYTTRVEDLVDVLQGFAFDPPTLRAELDAWIAAKPRSAWALATRGDYRISWAWEARGGGYANTVTEEGWRLFGERLRLAYEDLSAALQRDPACEPALVSRMILARGLSVERPQAEAWFAEACAVQPPLINAWKQYLQYLMPKWHGDDQGRDMWALVARARKEHPDEAALAILACDAHMELDRASGGRWLKSQAADVRASYQKVLEAYPRSGATWADWRIAAWALDDKAAFREALERGAELGDANAQSYLAEFLEGGKQTFRRDPLRARGLYWRAAHGGQAHACAKVGEWYSTGVGVPRDPERAVAWYRRAANGGDGQGQLLLAACYESGFGVPRDRREALRWYQAASRHQNAKQKAAAKAQELEGALWEERRAEARADGYEDTYPQDISPPEGTNYPSPLSPLPHPLTGITREERGFVNHTAGLLLRAARARLAFWEDEDDGALAAYAREVQAVGEALRAEAAPPGLEPFVDDLLRALEAQVEFHRQLLAGLEAEQKEIAGLAVEEQQERLRACWQRLHQTLPAGQTSTRRLHAAWDALESRYGATWAPEVRDSLQQHLAALDVF